LPVRRPQHLDRPQAGGALREKLECAPNGQHSIRLSSDIEAPSVQDLAGAPLQIVEGDQTLIVKETFDKRRRPRARNYQ
jgi:hypothetical protein